MLKITFHVYFQNKKLETNRMSSKRGRVREIQKRKTGCPGNQSPVLTFQWELYLQFWERIPGIKPFIFLVKYCCFVILQTNWFTKLSVVGTTPMNLEEKSNFEMIFLELKQMVSLNCWKYFCVCHNKSPLVEFTNSGSNSEPNISLLPSCWIQNISKLI